MSRAHELAKALRQSLLIGRSGRGNLLALAELERLAADAERYREALEWIAADLPAGYQAHQRARAALEAAA